MAWKQITEIAEETTAEPKAATASETITETECLTMLREIHSGVCKILECIEKKSEADTETEAEVITFNERR